MLLFIFEILKFIPLFDFQKKGYGSDLIEQVFYHLDILEKDYFGLQYTDAYNVNVSYLVSDFL